MQILVIEGNDAICASLCDVLCGEGYEVSSTDNSLEAIRLEALPAWILLDLVMPMLSGWEFRVQQLLDPRTASIPVAAMIEGAGPRTKATWAMFQDWLSTPISWKRLFQVVHRYCGDLWLPSPLPPRLGAVDKSACPLASGLLVGIDR